jgi:ubiquinone/menaquinone biosynthesis C-methylase UbiE
MFSKMGLTQRLFLMVNRFFSRDRDMLIYRNDFDNCAQSYDIAVTRRLLGKFTENVLKELDLKPGMRCVDLGCGTGHGTEIMDRLVRPQGSVIGYDISECMLGIARKKLGHDSVAKFIKKDMLDALRDHQSDSIDLITSFWALGYSKPESVLKEINRVLVKGGYAALLVNIQTSLYELQKLVLKILIRHPFILKYIPPINFPPNHKEFRRMVKHSGLKIDSLSENSCMQSFDTGASIVSWMKTAGPCAGFRGALREDRQEYVFNKIQEAVDRDGGINLTFRFIRFIGKK